MPRVHAVTATQKTWMSPLRNCGVMAMRLPRISSLHPLPWTRDVDKVIPELNRKSTGNAFHIPTTSNMSGMDLTCHLEKAAKYSDIKVVKQALAGYLKGILGYSEDQVISCEFNSDTHLQIFM